MNKRPKFLVIRFSSIGDIVLTSPVIRAIKEQVNDAPEVHFLTKEAYANILLANPRVDKVYTIKESTSEVIDDLKSEEYDYIIDLHRNIRSHMVKRSLKMIDFTFRKLNWQKWLLVNFGIDRMPKRHIVDRYLETLRPFGIKPDDQGLEYYIPKEEELDASKHFPGLSGKYITIALGAAHLGKRMPSALIEEVCEGSLESVILLGGPKESEEGDRIAARFPKKVFNAAGRCSLHGSASLIQGCEAIVTGDTGMMHIAAALSKKVISVWGCTTPSLGMYPYRPAEGSAIIEPHGRNKRPCSKLGDRCKYGAKDRCIMHVPAADILKSLYH